jgi:hypothetical protein
VIRFPKRNKSFFLKRPDRLWNPPSLVFVACWVFLPWCKRGLGVKLITYPCLVPTAPPVPSYALMLCTETSSPLLIRARAYGYKHMNVLSGYVTEFSRVFDEKLMCIRIAGHITRLHGFRRFATAHTERTPARVTSQVDRVHIYSLISLIRFNIIFPSTPGPEIFLLKIVLCISHNFLCRPVFMT